MEKLKVCSLFSDDAILGKFRNFFTEDEMSNDEIVAYINEHAADDDAPSLYVGTYKKYNEGSLYGMWVDLASFDSYDEFIEFCEALHSDEEDPELMFQDYQNFPDRFYSESGIDEDDFDVIKMMSEMDEDEKEAFEEYIDEVDGDIEDFHDRYKGKWDSEEDFAEMLFEDCYAHELSDFARNYFDIERFARDVFDEYCYTSSGHVFEKC